jgi:hypothetical protein
METQGSKSQETIAKEHKLALAYAERLAIALARVHYPENTQWRPLTGDLLGLLSQIDNMTSTLFRRRQEDPIREEEYIAPRTDNPIAFLSEMPPDRKDNPNSRMAMVWAGAMFGAGLIFLIFYLFFKDYEPWPL